MSSKAWVLVDAGVLQAALLEANIFFEGFLEKAIVQKIESRINC